MAKRDWDLLTIRLSLSDVIFRQHICSMHKLNFYIIVLQMIALFGGLLLSIAFDERIMYICGALNITLCLVCHLNIRIHNKTWEDAKKSLQDVNLLINSIGDDAENENKDV